MVKSKSRIILLVLVTVLVGYQAVVSWTDYIRPTAIGVWGLRDAEAWVRTGTILLGDRTTGHFGFLRESIPEDARVVLPPHSGGIYDHIGLVQYFLVPRDIINCGPNEVEACVKRVAGKSTFILAVGNFPPRDVAEETKRFVEYDDDLGVYVPK